jgi:O-antigen ligase
MAFGCLLSIIWVVMLPEIAVHQLTDAGQTVHAGLWRGIFTHKQGLGVFAGFSFGLVLFYGSLAFPMLLVRLGALGCAGACLFGTESATGLIVAILMPVFLFGTHWIARLPNPTRLFAVKLLVLVFVISLVAFYFNVLSFVPALFGKSSDLTGRSGSWMIIRDNFANSGRTLLGGGFGSDFGQQMSLGLAIDNGYLTKLVEFGYIGFALVFSVFGWLFFACMGLLLKGPGPSAELRAFPASLMIVLAFLCITETGLMEKNIITILMSIAVHIVFQERIADPAPAPNEQRAGNYAAGSWAQRRGRLRAAPRG